MTLLTLAVSADVLTPGSSTSGSQSTHSLSHACLPGMLGYNNRCSQAHQVRHRRPFLDVVSHSVGARTSLATHASGDSNSGLDTMQDFHSSVRSMLPLISLKQSCACLTQLWTSQFHNISMTQQSAYLVGPALLQRIRPTGKVLQALAVHRITDRCASQAQAHLHGSVDSRPAEKARSARQLGSERSAQCRA